MTGSAKVRAGLCRRKDLRHLIFNCSEWHDVQHVQCTNSASSSDGTYTNMPGCREFHNLVDTTGHEIISVGGICTADDWQLWPGLCCDCFNCWFTGIGKLPAGSGIFYCYLHHVHDVMRWFSWNIIKLSVFLALRWEHLCWKEWSLMRSLMVIILLSDFLNHCKWFAW